MINENFSQGPSISNASGKCIDVTDLVEQLNYFASANSWKRKNETICNISKLINNNLRLIFSQIGNNDDNTQQLKKSMLDLKTRIFGENCGSAANTLAFDIQCYAMGLFVEKPSSEYKLPDEILKIIFQQLLPKQLLPKKLSFSDQKMNSGLGGCTWTSKNWHQNSNEVKKEWVQFEGISLRKVSNCQTAKEAVDFIIKNKLTAANLSEFPDLTDDDLAKLIENCPNLTFLCIRSSKITEGKLAEALKTLTQLQHLDLSYCFEIKGDKLAEALKTLTQLQHLSLMDCIWITGDKLADALKTLTQLQHLNLGGCTKITGVKLAEALKTLTQLQHLDLGFCNQITEDKLVDVLKTLIQLQHLNLDHCRQIRADKLADALKTLTQLKHLDLDGCRQITGDKLAEALKTLTQLQHLNLGGCTQITGDNLAEALKMLTQLRHLDLSFCCQITGDKLAEALKILTQMKHLNLESCSQITGDKLAEALKTLTQLQHLNLSHCDQITGDKLAEIRKEFPNCIL